MLNIRNTAGLARALDSPISDVVKALLHLRRDQLLADTDREYDLAELVHFVVVEPGDTIAEVEAAAGYPVITTAAFEWVAKHGGWFEAVAILSDDGFGVVLIVEDSERSDPVLLALLRSHIIPSPADAGDSQA
jgi:hypothetical protein